MPHPITCPHCGHLRSTSSLPVAEVKRLEFELMELKHKLEFSTWEGGIYFERLQALKFQIHDHEQACEANQAEQKDYKLRILAVERQLLAVAVDSGEKRSP